MRLIEVLRSKDQGNVMADRLVNEIRVRALSKLEHIRDLFPHFTDHSIRHSDGVIAILDWLVPDEVKMKLNEWEIYFLLAAAYLHDIGMVESCPASPSGDEWGGFLEEFASKHAQVYGPNSSAAEIGAKREFIRDHHHERSEIYIREHWLELGLRAFDNPAEAGIVGRLSLGHRKVDLHDRGRFGEIAFGNNQLIRRDLLAAYLRMADELDTTAYRTPWAEYEIIPYHDDVSALEWAKHLSIRGVFANNGTLIIGGECFDHGVYLRLLGLEEELKKKLVEVRRMLPHPYVNGDGFHLEDPFPYHELKLEIEHTGYLPINIQFELQHREIINLIMGERLYGDRTACIREVLQNAVDTCREALEIRPAVWTPEISVSHDADNNTITISDNGMGMNEYIIRNYFSRVGISYYSSDDFHGSFQPISEFGIGVLSCFMLAKKIEIESLRNGSDSIYLEIASLTKPFVPRKGQKRSPGTTIRLYLEESEEELDILERVRHYARHVEYPIEVVDTNGSRTTVLGISYLPRIHDVLSLLDERYREYYSEGFDSDKLLHSHMVIQSSGVTLGVTLFRGEDFRHYHLREHAGGRISQYGFNIGRFDEEIEGIASRAWCEINLKDEACLNLTADRTRAVGGGGLWARVADMYGEAVEKLYPSPVNKQSSSPWWDYHARHYPARLRVVPAALREATLDNAKLCMFDQSGYHTIAGSRVSELPTNRLVLSYSDHEQLGRLQHLVPPDVCCIIVPSQFDFRHYYKPPDVNLWLEEIFELQAMNGAKQFFEACGITCKRVTIDGKFRSFLDAKANLGIWRVDWSVINAAFEVSTVFNLNNSFSQLLVNHCQLTLPRTSSLILAEVFRKAHLWSVDELNRHQTEVFQALQGDGVVKQTDVFLPDPQMSVPQHSCPYRSS